VYVQLEGDAMDKWTVVSNVKVPRLVCNEVGTAYVALQLPGADAIDDDVSVLACTLQARLKFVVIDCDPATHEPDTDQGYDDEYQVRLS
jgi:hypothetical protein